MRILGIDPGYGTTGFGLIELVGTEWEAIDYGCILTDANDEFPLRLQQIYDDITELIEELEPDIIAIEELFFAKNVTTALNVAEARGVIILAAMQAELRIHEYKPNEVKMALTGYGAAKKPQMQYAIQEELNLNKTPQPDDAADALAVALTCGFDVVRV